MIRPSRWTRLKEATSQWLCVACVDGDADEMLSSWAYRTGSKLTTWINWIFRDENHCRDSYEWEKANYKVERFK